jgi:hypothetical protein
MNNSSVYTNKQVTEAAKIMEHYLLMLAANLTYKDASKYDESRALMKTIQKTLK